MIVGGKLELTNGLALHLTERRGIGMVHISVRYE